MGLMQYLVTERAITYEQREIVIHALMHIPSDEITPRYRQSVGIAGVVDAQERVARPDRRRA